jgi:hypothetical protein
LCGRFHGPLQRAADDLGDIEAIHPLRCLLRLPQNILSISSVEPCLTKTKRFIVSLYCPCCVLPPDPALDWNHWSIDEWPYKLEETRATTQKPIWVSEVGASSFGAEEVQEFGLQRTAELLLPRVPQVYWYSLFDLPKAWPATTLHRGAEGSSWEFANGCTLKIRRSTKWSLFCVTLVSRNCGRA